MSKKILLLVLLTSIVTLFSSRISAQEASTPLIPSLGVRAGLNFTNLYTTDAIGNMAFGLELGAFGKLPLTNSFAIQPELNFTMKGARVTYNSVQVNGDANYNLNYLEIPLLGVFNLTDNISLHAGPYFAYLLSGSVKNGSSSTFDFESRINPDNYNRVDWGGALGASLNMSRFGLGMRVTQGFSTVGKEIIVTPTTIRFPDASNFKYTIYVAFSLI